MLEYHVDIVALAGDIPDRFAELAGFLEPAVVFGRADFRHLAPAVELFAVDHAFGAKREDEFAFAFVGNHADRVRARHRAELNGERAKAAARAPDENVVAGPQDVRTMAKEHPIGGCKRERVTGRFFPSEMLGPFHQLAVLHPRELRKGAVWRFVTPDAL